MYFNDLSVGMAVEIAPAVIEKQKMLEFAKNCNVKCFTYLSSVAVYGFYGYKNITEDGEKKP